MSPDAIVAIGVVLIFAGLITAYRWAPHARDLALELWDAVSTRPADKETIA